MATIIRLQLMEEKAKGRGSDGGGAAAAATTGGAATALLPSDFDVLYLCGSDGGCQHDEESSDTFQPTCAGRPSSSPPSATDDEAPGLPVFPWRRPAASCRLEKAVDTTADTAPSTDIDESFLSASSSFLPREDDDDLDRLEGRGGDEERQEDAELLQCAVCLGEAVERSCGDGTILPLPCCGNRMCRSCLAALTAPARHDECRVGRCPCCRSWIVVESSSNGSEDGATAAPSIGPGFQLHLVSVAGKCQVCCQVKQLLVDDSSTCDECFVGLAHPALLYECDRCRREQRVPRPLYRYQDTPDTFGSAAHPCAACNHVCRWRIRPDQVPLVPVADAPPGWSENPMDKARARVPREGGGASPGNSDGEEGRKTPSWDQASLYLHEVAVSSSPHSCTVL
jgi:hypothetical protein